MAVTASTPTPYAPPSAIMEIVNRFRRGLPAPINTEVLGRAGISDSLIPRTMQALQTLDLIDDAGTPTTHLEGLRRAPEPEFQQRLAEWLNTAYADVLAYIDPATADEGAIRDAFRNYNPVGQQPRMVTLFMGLYTAAGVRTTERSSAPRAPRITQARILRAPMAATKSSAKAMMKANKLAKVPGLATIMPPVMGLLETLPDPEVGWTKQKRDAFVALFGSTLDFCYPIVTQAELNKKDNADE